MFTTPRLPTTARRSLEFGGRASSSTNQQQTTSQERSSRGQGNGIGAPQGSSSDQINSNSNEEVLTMLRSLQQQVSAMQAQQNQAASDRTERNPTPAPNSSLNDKRKLPKEVWSMLDEWLF